MPRIGADSPWPLAAIHVGAALFVVALAASVFFDPAIWVLHALQALIYVAVMVLAQRKSPLGFGAGFAIALLWNGANLLATGFIAAALRTLPAGLSTGHILRPVLLLVLLGAAGHFLMIAGCLAGFFRSSRGCRPWARFLGGAVLGLVALVLISPLRFRLHAQPLPLDVAPQRDVLTAVAGLQPAHYAILRNRRAPRAKEEARQGLGSNMLVDIGQVEAIFRYPVKSIAGERLEVAELGWHGLEGDRRLAFRRMDHRSGFPWLTASKLSDLLLFAPRRRENGDGVRGELPTHVRTPDGEELPVFGEDLAAEVGRRHGSPVQMMQLNHGIFDEGSLSVIAAETVHEIGRLAGRSLDVRRFRPNVVVRLLRPVPFQEDEWVGGVLSFGEGDDAPAITVTMRDVRCSMVAFDPDSASSAPEVLKAVVRANQNTAGIYGTVTRIGRLAVGQTLRLRAD